MYIMGFFFIFLSVLSLFIISQERNCVLSPTHLCTISKYWVIIVHKSLMYPLTWFWSLWDFACRKFWNELQFHWKDVPSPDVQILSWKMKYGVRILWTVIWHFLCVNLISYYLESSVWWRYFDRGFFHYSRNVIRLGSFNLLLFRKWLFKVFGGFLFKDSYFLRGKILLHPFEHCIVWIWCL